VDPITRGWAVVTSAGVVRLGLGFVASLLIARALGPSDFGVYAVLAATVAIVGGLGEGGLTEAAVLRISAMWPADAQSAQRRAQAFFWLRLGLAALTVAIGCTGGQHRSVYLIERLARQFSPRYQVLVRHRNISLADRRLVTLPVQDERRKSE